MNTFIKDPDALLDYTVDWSEWLMEDDEIASADWVVPAGLTEESASNTASTATVWLSGGTAGSEYDVVSRIVTADGREDDRTITIQVTQK
jgi:hypothetical protein